MWLRLPVVVLILLLTFAIIYKVTPNIDQPLRYVTPGSVVGVLVWIIASVGFSAYVENFGNYGATYGSLGGIVVLLLYFFVSSGALLFGAEINAVIHPATDPLVDAPSDPADVSTKQSDRSRPGRWQRHGCVLRRPQRNPEKDSGTSASALALGPLSSPAPVELGEGELASIRP